MECSVEWSTGSVANPLFTIVVNQIGEDYAPFTSLHPRHPNRHITIAHMDQIESMVYNWGYHTTRACQKFHGRKLILILEQPRYYAEEGGINLDPEHDTLASYPDIRILHKAYKPNEASYIPIRITL